MDRTAEIRDLFAFNRWANTRMLGALAALSAEEFSRDLKSSHPSVRDTVLHVMGSEWIWLSRWLGTSPTGMPPEWSGYTLEQIALEWDALQAAQTAFLEKLTDRELDRLVSYRNLAGEDHTNILWQLLRHMVNHSSYHRGQVTTMLRQLGHKPVATDLVVYYRLQQAASI